MRAWPIDLALMAAGRWPRRRSRWGLDLPAVQPGSVWLHGASLGEARAARVLAERLTPAFVTCDTAAGLLAADGLRPVDHPWTLSPLWAEARPRLVVMIGGSWWPGLARLARRTGVPVIGIGVRATRGFMARSRLLGGPDAVFAATASDAARLSACVRVLGVCGTGKFAVSPDPGLLTWEQPFLAVASAREGDCEALIAARAESFPEQALLLAPRHPGRPPDTGRPLLARSSGVSHVPPGHDLWLDTLGELPRALVGATAALVGGTFAPTIQGHSPIEARAAGVPVVHGPCIDANRSDYVDTVLAPTPAQLGAALERAIAAGPPPPPPDPARLATLLEEQASVAVETSPRPWAPVLPSWRPRTMRPVPWVIATGSANRRGSGKTSTAAVVAHAAARRGCSVVVVTRGTGRWAPGVGDSLVHGPDPWWLGDEGAALALQGLRVLAHPSRARALQGVHVDIAVLEDGLVTDVAADRVVHSIDARYPSGRGLMLKGEQRTGVPDADVIVAHHSSARFPCPPTAIPAVRTPGEWSRQPGACVAFTGIARPADFFATVPEAQATRSFPNHSWHTPARMDQLFGWADGRDLVTTDRDLVRIPPMLRGRVCARGLNVEVPGFPWEAVLP